MNLAEFPIALLTDRVPKDQREAIYQDEIHDERSGLTLTRKLTITAGNHGLTTALDDEVILSLIQLTKKKNDFTQRRVEFSRYELVQLLGWSMGGVSYERIATALDRWTSVYLKYENAWRDNRTKSWMSAGFHIIERFELNDNQGTTDQLGLIPSFIVWNEVIFESFQAGYLKPLDYDLCMGLSNSTAKRMYRFLDKRFHHKPDWTFDLKELAHEHIGPGRNYDGPAHLKRKLLPAIAELEAIGFLGPLPDAERFPKDGRTWKIRLIRAGQSREVARGEREIALARREGSKAKERESPPEINEIEQALIARGVTPVVAAGLAGSHPDEQIQERIEIFDWLLEKKDRRVSKNPGGYLAESIRKGYVPPKGFESKTAREQKQADELERKRQAEEAKQRTEAAEKAREQAEQLRVSAYLDALTPEEREALQAEALAQANPFFARQYRQSKGNAESEARYFKLIVAMHVSGILADRE